MWKQDTSLEFAVQDLVAELEADSEDFRLLAEYARDSGEDLAEGLVEILGLSPDEAASTAKRIAARMGMLKMRASLDRLADLLQAKGVELSPQHRRILALAFES